MMSSFASRWFAFLALLVVCLDLSAGPLYIRAQGPQAEDVEVTDAPAKEEAAKAEDVEVTDAPAKEEVASEAPEGGEAKEGAEGEEGEEKGQQFVDSARELQEKLAQLKALLDARGEGADPALKEKLSGLENQLKDLGLDSLTGGGVGSNRELTEFLGACVAMSMRRLGMQRPATLGALRKLVEGKMLPEQAAKNELWRMVGVCVGEMKEDEFADFKTGKMKLLPKAYETASKKPEAEKKVLEIDAQVWEELRSISDGLLKELTGGPGEKPPFNAAYLAFIPLGLMIAFLVKMFLDMNKEKEKKLKSKSKLKSGEKLS